MMKLVMYGDKKYGILYKNSIFDINTFEKVEAKPCCSIKSGKLNNLPNMEINSELISKLRRKFPYTKIGNTIVFHINWVQKFFIKINKDNTMNIYSNYPIFILKRFLKFIT